VNPIFGSDTSFFTLPSILIFEHALSFCYNYKIEIWLFGEMGRDKRQHERIEITSSRSVVNISTGGMYIKTDEPRSVGSIVHFEFKLDPDLPPIKGHAKVIRALYKGGGRKGLPPGMALEFTSISPEDQKVIRDYIKLRQSIEML
jgi:hypothetical protein